MWPATGRFQGRLCCYELWLAGCHVDDMTGRPRSMTSKNRQNDAQEIEAKRKGEKKKIDEVRRSNASHDGPARLRDKKEGKNPAECCDFPFDARTLGDQRETVGRLRRLYKQQVVLTSVKRWMAIQFPSYSYNVILLAREIDPIQIQISCFGNQTMSGQINRLPRERCRSPDCTQFRLVNNINRLLVLCQQLIIHPVLFLLSRTVIMKIF